MKLRQAVILFLIVVLGACKPTKYVPEGDYLLRDVKIETEELNLTAADLRPYIKQNPNLKILGLFKFHLGLYNASGQNLDRWWNRWLRRIGEDPVVYDKFLAERSAIEIEKHLNNKGFLYASVTDTTIFFDKARKARVVYNVTENEPFKILSHNKKISDPNIKSLIDADSLNSLIMEGDNFDIDVLNKERERITRLLRKNGYYNFSRDYIYYVADSSVQPLSVVDTMIVSNPTIVNELNQRVEATHLQYTVRDVYFIDNFNPQLALKQQNDYYQNFDTLEYNGYKVLYKDELLIKPVILTINNLIKPNEQFNYLDVDRTHALLSAIPIIKYVNIRFVENRTIEPTLDCYIQITPSKSQSYSIDLEGTNQAGNIGAAVNLGYSHKNLFKGGEMFTTKFSYARETQTGLQNIDVFNSDELGAETSLLYPRFLFPFLSRRFNENFKSNTNFNANLNYQNRPDYKRYISGIGMQYNWKGKGNWSHRFDILDWSYVNIFDVTDAFTEYIDTIFLRYSYDDHVILGLGYSLTYNDQETRNFRDSRFLRIGVESSGNTLYGYNSLLGSPKDNGAYNFVGIPYSQYIKFDVEGTYNRKIDEKNSVVYHAALGLGVPYGNVDVMPFEKRYFGGGANGIRGWQVRSLGPGVYTNNRVNYMNQSGDIRIQANLEYRFKLLWVVEGALFTDLGNVWTIRSYNNDQPGGVFLFDTFYKQLALAYGIGARLDFSFFVFRLDLGIKGYDPIRSPQNRWVSSPSFSNDMTLHLAIGYPF